MKLKLAACVQQTPLASMMTDDRFMYVQAFCRQRRVSFYGEVSKAPPLVSEMRGFESL